MKNTPSVVIASIAALASVGCSEPKPKTSEKVIQVSGGLSQESRRQFLRDYFHARRAAVVATTVTPTGDFIDWVPRDPGIASPPPLALRGEANKSPARSIGDSALTDVRAQTWLQKEPSLRGPPGTVPQQYIDVEKLIAANPDLPENPLDIYRRVAPSPDANGRYYVVWSNTAGAGPYYGSRGAIGLWNVPTVVGNDTSILETTVERGSGTLRQTVEAGMIENITVNPGSTDNHFFVYFTTVGHSAEGHWIGGYNRLQDGFIQWSTTVFPGDKSPAYSQPGGARVDSVFEVRIFEGNWWVFAFGDWVGYYPRCKFNDSSEMCATPGKPHLFAEFTGIRFDADVVQWFGEVKDQNAPMATATDMGSGTLLGGSPPQALGYAAYFRSVAYYHQPAAYLFFNDVLTRTSATDGFCYFHFLPGYPGDDPDGANMMYLGGGGAGSPNCF
jgi:hypothetical protein